MSDGDRQIEAVSVEVIAIGNELLAGVTVNTNATFISERFVQAGFLVSRHQVVPDEREVIQEAIRVAMKRSDVVVCTGGLGPTLDDLTRPIVAEIFHSDFYFNQEVADQLYARYGDRLVSLDDQATLPSKAIPFLNDVGTAPGLLFEDKGRIVVLVPGVPVEMRAMVQDKVIPYLQNRFPISARQYREKLFFCQLSESKVDPLLRELRTEYPELGFGIYPSQGFIAVHLVTHAESEVEGRKKLAGASQRLCHEFASFQFDSPFGRIEEAIQRLFISNNWTISTAESCTGGSIAATLTGVSKASHYFLGSVVSYANSLKMNLLGVPESDLAEHGAVSEEVVIAMAKGVIEKTGSDYSIATSGIAGPDGGTEEKPVGTVWLAIGQPNGSVYTRCLQMKGNREAIVRKTVLFALSELWILLSAARGELNES